MNQPCWIVFLFSGFSKQQGAFGEHTLLLRKSRIHRFLARLAKAIDSQLDDIAFAEKLRRIEPQTNAGWSSCRNNVSWKQRHELAEVAHHLRDVENQIAGDCLEYILIVLGHIQLY